MKFLKLCFALVFSAISILAIFGGCSNNTVKPSTSGGDDGGNGGGDTPAEVVTTEPIRYPDRSGRQQFSGKLGETVDWKNEVKYTLTQAGYGTYLDEKYILFNISVENNSNSNLYLSTLDRDSVLAYNDNDLYLTNVGDITALIAGSYYFKMTGWGCEPGAEGNFVLPIHVPENIGKEIKIEFFPLYSSSPDSVVFTVETDQLKELTAIK